MASYTNILTGTLNSSKAFADLKKAKTQAESLAIVEQFLKDSGKGGILTAGVRGTTKADQQAAYNLISAFGDKYGFTNTESFQNALEMYNYTNDIKWGGKDAREYALEQLKNITAEKLVKGKETTKEKDTSPGAGVKTNSAPSLSSFTNAAKGAKTEPKPDPLPEWAFDLNDFANHFGLMLKYEDILKEKEAATDAKFKEYDTQAQRAEHGVLRAQDAAYDQYLQGLRNQTANAVSTGAMRGANQANALAEMLAMQQGNKETGTAFSDLMFDLMQQRGTAREEDKLWARDLEQQRRFKIADYEQGRYATLVNDRVGELNYAGAVNAAGLNALGSYMQGLASAAGTRDAAYIGTQGQMDQYSKNREQAIADLITSGMTYKDAIGWAGHSALQGTGGASFSDYLKQRQNW